MNLIGYKIIKEVAIKDKNKYYDIISYEKGKEKLSSKVLKYGKSKNKDYYKHLYETEKIIFKECNFKHKIIKLPELIRLKFISI